MPERSAGLLLYRQRGDATEVLLVHPGGPFWARKDAAAWSIPKGVVDPGEDLLAAARREFQEETGRSPPTTVVRPLGEFRQAGGKIVIAFAAVGDFDVDAPLASNSFTMEWPPKSGRTATFPEVDRAAWFELGEAEGKIHKGQQPILAALADLLAKPGASRR